MLPCIVTYSQLSSMKDLFYAIIAYCGTTLTISMKANIWQ